jgi:hypothetical protein
MNLRDYVRRFHVTDKCTGAWGHTHVTPYIRWLTDEYMGPGACPRWPCDPYMHWLTNEFNLYIRRLTNKFSYFFTTACFGCLPGRGASITG